MAITGIFFGSDTGNTENIAKMIQKQLGKDVADVHDIAKSSKEDLEAYEHSAAGHPNLVLLAKRSVTGMTSSRLSRKRLISTANWLRCLVVVTRKITPNISADALGTIRDIIEPRGATIVGHWPTAGYHFEASKGLAI